MTNQPPPELFVQPAAQPNVVRARPYRLRRVFTCLVAAALLGGGVYEIYLWKRVPLEIPTIRADGTLKQKPEQPGGIDIPNQDVLAYQQIDGSEARQPAAEHLLPPPETPQPVTETLPPPRAASAPPAIESLGAPVASVPVVTTVSPSAAAPGAPPAVTAPAKNQTAQANTDSPPSPPPAAPSSPDAAASAASSVPAQPATVNNIAPQAASVVPATGKKGYRVQLASFPDENEAEHEMGRMQEKFAGQLGVAKLHLAKADLGARGIYYRVQSNPITDSEARDICAALKNLKAGCLIVKP